MSHHQSDLFFFDQCSARRKYKRFRKPTELLPFSLRLTGLSGAVKVEAYLKQQHQKAGDSAQGKEKGFVTENSETPESRAAGPLGNFLLHKGDQSDLIDGKKQASVGKSLNLPDIGLHPGGIHSPLAIRSFEQLEGDDDEEDTQRFLFEENKFASQNLLAQLGRLLDQIHQEQLEELEEIQSNSAQFSRASTPQLVVAGEESIVTETIRSGGVVVPLPDDLHKKLSANFEELSSGVIYVRREWQTTSYREQAILQKRLGIMSESQTNVEAFKSGRAKNIASVDQNKAAASNDKLAAVRTSESKDLNKRKQSAVGESLTKIDLTDAELSRESVVPTPATDHSDILGRRETSRTSFYGFKPKTRLEKFKVFNEKSSERRKASTGIHFDEDEENQKDASDVHSGHGIAGQPTVINFSLLSKTCEERGWILHQDDASDLERQTLIEWARSRLQQSIREKDEMKEKARELGIDGPLVTKYYGDTHREAALKYKKGVSWAKRWLVMTMVILLLVAFVASFFSFPHGLLVWYVIYLLEALFFNPTAKGLMRLKQTDSILDYIEEIKACRPAPEVNAQCYHMETRTRTVTGKDGTRTEVYQERVDTARLTERLRVARWADDTGEVVDGLSYFPLLQVHFDLKWEAADPETHRAHEQQREALRARAHAADSQHDTSEELRLIDEHGQECPFYADMIGTTGEAFPVWLGYLPYAVACFLFLSWPYRYFLSQHAVKGDFVFEKRVWSYRDY